MLPQVLQSVQFFVALLMFDRDLADQARMGGCRRCGNRLHQADFARKPRGGPDLDEDCYLRFSLCCSVCRKRATPVSLRFMGRTVYFGVVHLLISAMMGDASALQRRNLRGMCGADDRTLGRWRQWWAKTFTQTSIWAAIGPRLALRGASTDPIANRLIEEYRRRGLRLMDAIAEVLHLLGPLTSVTAGGVPG